jgi:hypothetical protein
MSLATDLFGTYTSNNPSFGSIQITVDDSGSVTGTWNDLKWVDGNITVTVYQTPIAGGSLAYNSPGDNYAGGADYLVVIAKGSLPSPSSPGFTWMFVVTVSMYREVNSTGPFTAVVTLMRDGVGNSHDVSSSPVLFTKS